MYEIKNAALDTVLICNLKLKTEYNTTLKLVIWESKLLEWQSGLYWPLHHSLGVKGFV